MPRQYLPFYEVKNRPALIVDSVHPSGLTLSHWRGAATPAELRDDTSAGSVLNALRQNHPGLQSEWVTANHFDVDGFVGVWSLLNPERALQREALLREMAVIGDFRELDLGKPAAEEALQLVCWLNAVEKERFYPPFGAEDREESEVRLSPAKFGFFLPAFGKVLAQPETGRHHWQAEYDRVLEDYALIHGPQTHLTAYPSLGLVVVETPRPVHYYALFSVTVGYDAVLSLYHGNRYELEQKYTTWIDLASRPTLPRVSLAPLAARLNALEDSSAAGQWHAEPVTDTGPILRRDRQPLRKVQRYANPYERPVLPSSIPPEALKNKVKGYLEEKYAGIVPKKYWTWEEVKRLNRG
ncbi:MAG: hypothetical protein H7Z75_20320 [Ferruginibacter sp.]|nr:hypothetical protein [Cytophagales bacterium]